MTVGAVVTYTTYTFTEAETRAALGIPSGGEFEYAAMTTRERPGGGRRGTGIYDRTLIIRVKQDTVG